MVGYSYLGITSGLRIIEGRPLVRSISTGRSISAWTLAGGIHHRDRNRFLVNELLRAGLLRPVYHGENGLRTLKDQLARINLVTLVTFFQQGIPSRIAHHDFRDGSLSKCEELSRSYLTISKDLTRVMNRLKALYRGWGICCEGATVYAPHHRSEWLGKITEAGVRRRAEFFYQQLDALQALRQQVRRDLLAESRNHSARKLLRQIPSIGPIRAALLIALIQTPHRFRTKRQLWAYSGLAIETHDSAQYRYVAGQLQRSKKPQQLRGLNRNHNHDLKAIFKGAATKAGSGAGPFHDFYQALLTKGMRPSMARLILARKIAAITLIVWKKGAHFDVEQLKPQAA